MMTRGSLRHGVSCLKGRAVRLVCRVLLHFDSSVIPCSVEDHSVAHDRPESIAEIVHVIVHESKLITSVCCISNTRSRWFGSRDEIVSIIGLRRFSGSLAGTCRAVHLKSTPHDTLIEVIESGATVADLLQLISM
jgi:hypothetical protein